MDLATLLRQNTAPFPDGVPIIDVGYILSARLPLLRFGFKDGARAFHDWLKQLRSVPMVDVKWSAQWEESGLFIPLEPDTTAFFDRFRTLSDALDDGYMVNADESSTRRVFDAQFDWGGRKPQLAELSIYRADPRFGTAAVQYIEMIRITTAWQRPQHLSFGPTR